MCGRKGEVKPKEWEHSEVPWQGTRLPYSGHMESWVLVFDYVVAEKLKACTLGLFLV